MLTLERLLELMDFDAEAGRFTWRGKPHPRNRHAGKEAGTPVTRNGKTYWAIKIDGKMYKRGRLAYFVTHGKMPFPCVDHRDSDSLNDRPDNLREATVLQNSWNHKPYKRRIKLPMGVRIIAWSGRYQARINCNKQQIHLGAFDTPEEAHAVYLEKRRELFKEFA
jgi:HNH endonuclease